MICPACEYDRASRHWRPSQWFKRSPVTEEFERCKVCDGETIDQWQNTMFDTAAKVKVQTLEEASTASTGEASAEKKTLAEASTAPTGEASAAEASTAPTGEASAAAADGYSVKGKGNRKVKVKVKSWCGGCLRDMDWCICI